MKMSRANQYLLKVIEIDGTVFFKSEKNGKEHFILNIKLRRATHSLLKVIKRGSTLFVRTQKNIKEHLIIKIKTGRATHSLVKVIQIGNNVFFEPLKNRNEHLGKVCHRSKKLIFKSYITRMYLQLYFITNIKSKHDACKYLNFYADIIGICPFFFEAFETRIIDGIGTDLFQQNDFFLILESTGCIFSSEKVNAQ